MDKKELRILRKKLPVGWAKILSEQTGKSLVMVYKVISGEANDKDDIIITKAIELAEAEIKKQKERISKIRSL